MRGSPARVAAAAIALFTFGPAYLRHTLSAIFVISRDVEAAAPYRIEVKPGQRDGAKGADQMISATLSGFDAARSGHPDAQGIGDARSSACRW